VGLIRNQLFELTFIRARSRRRHYKIADKKKRRPHYHHQHIIYLKFIFSSEIRPLILRLFI